MKELILTLLFISSWAINIAVAQDYSCSFLNAIMTDVRDKGGNYNTYFKVLDGKIKDATTTLKTNERRDSLFHIDEEITLVDTFNFFSDACTCNKKYGIKVINKPLGLSSIQGKSEVVTVQSIRVYNNYFIITLRNPRTENVTDFTKTVEALDFKFELIANLPPKLVAVERWFLE